MTTIRASEIIREITADLARGDHTLFIGCIDWLIHDRGYSVERLYKFGERTLQISRETCEMTIFQVLAKIGQERALGLIKDSEKQVH